MDPDVNKNPEKDATQVSDVAPSQLSRQTHWMEPPSNEKTIIMVPNPGYFSKGNEVQVAANSHQMEPLPTQQPVDMTSYPRKTSSDNGVQPATHSHRMGPSPNNAPATRSYQTGPSPNQNTTILTPGNTSNSNEVQLRAQSYRMRSPPNRQPVPMMSTPFNTFTGNEVQLAAHSLQMGSPPNRKPVVMMSNPSNMAANNNRVQPAAHSYQMGPPPSQQHPDMIPTLSSNTSSGSGVQSNTSQAHVIGTGSLHLTGSNNMTSNLSPAGSNSVALTNRIQNMNPMISCRPPPGADTFPVSSQVLPRLHIDRNLSLNCINPYADQGFVPNSRNLQVNSSLRPHANPHAFSTGQYRAMLQASINRPPNTNG
jgi:hypothetical protein